MRSIECRNRFFLILTTRRAAFVMEGHTEVGLIHNVSFILYSAVFGVGFASWDGVG